MNYLHLAAAALLALAAPSAWAAEAAKVEHLRWPQPWSVGTTLEYESEGTESETKQGVETKSRTTSDTRIRIARKEGEGYVQEWVGTGLRHEVLQGDAAGAAAMADAMKGLEGFAVEVVLDKDGNYLRLGNVDAVGARLREVMAPVMQAAAQASLKELDADERAAATSEVDKRMASVLEQMTAPATLEALVGREPSVFNAFIGVDIEPNEWYEAATELDTPLGTKLPAKLQFVMYASEDDPDDIYLEWNSTIDPVKGLEATWDMVGKMLGTPVTAEQRKTLPDKVTIADEGFALFRRGTGVTEMYEYTRTVKLGEYTKVERNRMRLRDMDHDHVWKEEDTGLDDVELGADAGTAGDESP